MYNNDLNTNVYSSEVSTICKTMNIKASRKRLYCSGLLFACGEIGPGSSPSLFATISEIRYLYP